MGPETKAGRKKSLRSSISGNFLHNFRLKKQQKSVLQPDSTSPSSSATTIQLTASGKGSSEGGNSSSSTTRSQFSGRKSSKGHPPDPAPSASKNQVPAQPPYRACIIPFRCPCPGTITSTPTTSRPPPSVLNGSPRVYGRAKPKRSRSVGAVHHHELNVKAAANGYWPVNGHMASSRPTPPSDGITTNGGFRTPQTAYQCNQQFIDANFLALGQKDQPVMSSDLMYRRLEKLGEGSYATVFKSENRIDGSIVALKEIKLQPQEGLPFTAIREVSLLRGLKHANIVRLHQIVHQPHSLILVFEYMKTDLSKFMENYRHGLDPFRVKIFLFQLLRGLAFCHEKKILHRDLKPQNLLVSEEGELKLADFGLARAKSVPCRTFSHDVVTLWYRPPDVLLGSTHYSTSLDMWGVGCIFAEMCSGIPCSLGIRGLPDPEKWPEVKDLPNYANFHFSPYVELQWDQVDSQLSRIPDKGDCLLTTLLQLKPMDRISARQAMQHDFFCSLPAVVRNLQPTHSVVEALRTRI
uniref:cyclin-dependent kinase n=1 Tax=Ditylenchus dipsaci TaxID=166011 RepID=A0A915ELQ2_9BILA